MADKVGEALTAALEAESRLLQLMESGDFASATAHGPDHVVITTVKCRERVDELRSMVEAHGTGSTTL